MKNKCIGSDIFIFFGIIFIRGWMSYLRGGGSDNFDEDSQEINVYIFMRYQLVCSLVYDITTEISPII